MMINRLVNARFERIRIYHVRMSFSDSFKSVGNFGVAKVFHLFEVIWKILVARVFNGVSTLYFPPAGPNLTPFLRDVLLLTFTRPFFKHVIYHFRAAGISEFLSKQPRPIQLLSRVAYGSPAASIQLSALNPNDGRYFNSGRVYIVKNGLEDAAIPYLPLQKSWGGTIKILFAGVLREDKGVTVLVETARLLKAEGHDFQLTLLGEFASEEYEKEVLSRVKEFGLEHHVFFPGVKTGEAKWRYFRESHLFCFPSYFDSESFGNVVVEAMMFQLPVVATYWRGIPDIVVNGETGWLVPVRDPAALARQLSQLLNNPALGENMGKKGRERFLSSFTLAQHLKAMEEVLLEVTDRTAK
jgi:glycosyltransferase involved in cell wall biosynthesis